MKKILFIISMALCFNLMAQQTSVSNSIPVAAVMMFDKQICPSGWLPRDGSCVSSVKYKNLFAEIGTRYDSTFGVCPNGFFRLADARGIFNRGAGTNGTLSMANGTKYTGGSVGSYLTDLMQSHIHRAMGWINSSPDVPAWGAGMTYGGTTNVTGTDTRSPINDGSNGAPRTGPETRPVSGALLDCIKY